MKLPNSNSEPDSVMATPSEILFKIGTSLRQKREERGLSIEDISTNTQLQPKLIKAIEEGNIEILPESIYVRGMVKRYGNYLGLDGQSISQRVPAWEPEVPDFVPSVTRTTSLTVAPRVKPFYVYLGYIMLIVGGGAGISHLINDAIKPEPSLILPSSKINSPNPSNPVTLIPAATQPQGVEIGIVVKTSAWAQIGIDGATKFTGNLQSGTTMNWMGAKQVTISTNNGGALLLSQNRQAPQPIGKLGEKQQVTIKIVQ